MAKGSERHRSALRPDSRTLEYEEDRDGEMLDPLKSSSDSASLSSVSLSSDCKLVCIDRLGIVNCGMLSGVRTLAKMFSRLACESVEHPKDFVLLAAHSRPRIPALLCLLVVEKSSGDLFPPQIAPKLKVLVTSCLSIM